MTDFDLALRYLPAFYADEAEPFPVRRIGYSLIRESGRSPSFPREITLPEHVSFAVEYAVYFDYDIQHLYDLEHAWVYVGRDGRVADGEGSAHGAYFNAFRLSGGTGGGDRLPLYMQPGKHALLARGELTKLFPGYLSACDALAGKDGLLVAPMFEGRITKEPGTDERVAEFIRENFRFTPTLRFEPVDLPDGILVPLPELLREIPMRINAIQREIILNNITPPITTASAR